MMKKNLRFAGILLSAMLLIFSFGCLVQDTAPSEAEPTAAPSDTSAATEAPAYEADRDAVAVTLDNIEITAGEIEDSYNSYIQLLTYYGMTAPTDDETINEYVQMIIEDLLSSKLPLWKAEKEGIELTEDELAEIDVKAHNEADAEYKDLVLSYAAYYTDAGEVEDVSDLTEQQLADTLVYLNADVKDYYGDDSADIDFYVSDAYDNYYQQYLIEAYSAKLKEGSDACVLVDDEAVNEWYITALADQKEQFDQDATMYRTHREDYESGAVTTPLLYVPENLAAVQIITLTPEGEVPAEIAANLSSMALLEAEYGKLALSGNDEARLAEIRDEYASLVSANQQLEEEYFGAEYARISELKARLDSGEEYSAVAADNPAFLEEQIICCTGDYAYPAVITDAVSAMNDGENSDILFDGESYYLVHLVGKLAPGNADRTAIEDAIRLAASAEAQETAWAEITESWEAEAFAAAVYNRDAYAYVGH